MSIDKPNEFNLRFDIIFKAREFSLDSIDKKEWLNKFVELNSKEISSYVDLVEKNNKWKEADGIYRDLLSVIEDNFTNFKRTF